MQSGWKTGSSFFGLCCIALSTACTSSGGEKIAGSEGGPCLPNRTCHAGLICNFSNVCATTTANVCQGVTCSGHGTCSVVSGQAECLCDQGYTTAGSQCISDLMDGSVSSDADGLKGPSDGGPRYDVQHDSGRQDAAGDSRSRHDASAADTGGMPTVTTTLGVIRWDGWITGNSYPYCGIAPLGDPCYVGQWEEWALHSGNPAHKFYDRIPFYSVPSGTEPDFYIRATGVSGEQNTIDSEITYAANAHIDYFAYVWYPDVNPLAKARLLHGSSAKKNDVKMALINWNIADPTATCALFQQSYYQKVLGTRPLVYTYGYESYLDAATVTALRQACVSAGVGNPYIVEMNWDSAAAASYATSLGLDAISNYTVFAAVSNEPYQNMAARGVQVWNAHAATGKPVVPFIGAGWDPRPREGESVAYSAKATAVEVASEVFNARHWNRAQGSGVAAADTAIIYAWNEFSEGGWLCPLYTGGAPDQSRLDAIGAVKSTHPGNLASASFGSSVMASGVYANDPTYAAEKSIDGQYDSAWQCNQASNCWLEIQFASPTTFDKVVLSEYGDRVRGYKLQRWDGSGYVDLYTGQQVDGKYLGEHRYLFLGETTTSRLRLLITTATFTPIIYEFEVYHTL